MKFFKSILLLLLGDSLQDRSPHLTLRKHQAGIYKYDNLHGSGALYRTDLLITDASLLEDEPEAYQVLPVKVTSPLHKKLAFGTDAIQVTQIVFHDKYERVDPPVHNIALMILDSDKGEYTGLELARDDTIHSGHGNTLHLHGWNKLGMPMISRLSVATPKFCSAYSEFNLIDQDSEFCCDVHKKINLKSITKGSILIQPDPISPILVGLNPWPLTQRAPRPPAIALKISNYAMWIDDLIHLEWNEV